MKKIIFIVLMAAFLLSVAVACDKENPPPLAEFSVNYIAGEGGYIYGNPYQTINEGADSKSVTATPHSGYKFVKWSDNNSTEPTRNDLNIQKDLDTLAEFAKITLTVRYRSWVEDVHSDFDCWELNGGYVEGNILQSVEYGADANTVVAKPYAGYVFANWSDGNQNPERQDKNITSNLLISVKFVTTHQVLTYEYNGATSDNDEESVALTMKQLTNATFAVPKKEGYNFQGWFLEPELKQKAVNYMGQLLLGDEVFFRNDSKLYAKWTSEDVLVYPVLMIFATETQATLEANYKRSSTNIDTIYDIGVPYDIYVDYKMPEIERKICELIPTQLEKCLNEMLDGIVAFELDTYFSSETIDEKILVQGMNGYYNSYSVFAYKYWEVCHFLSNYRSVMTTFGLGDDYAGLLHTVGGSAGAKYAGCHIESNVAGFIRSGMSYEEVYEIHANEEHPDWQQIWNSLLGHYTHEFTHTVEQQCGAYNFHNVPNGLDVTRLYLRNEYFKDENRVGIPLSFWKGEGLEVSIFYTVDYEAFHGDMGTVSCTDESYDIFLDTSISKFIPYGSTAAEITAIPKAGYRFVKWSDGITTPTRQDTNIISLLIATAIFEKI